VLTIITPPTEIFNDETQEFTGFGAFKLNLEHSLASVSKWESRMEKPFLSSSQKTDSEIFDYIRDMAVDEDVPDYVFSLLTDDHIRAIEKHINSKMTATWFSDNNSRPRSSEVITAELIYYWMISFNVPFECQYWHLNRLLTLLKVCSVKNEPPKKMSRSEAANRQRMLNAERKARLNTTG
jgi:hypothetical protein